MKNRYNQLSAVLLAAGMAVIPSCGQKAPEPVSSTVTPAAATTAGTQIAPSVSPETEGSAPEPVFDYNGQLDVIAGAKNTWYVAGDSEMRYAITDLDMNGRYEITAAKKNQSFSIYEVNEDNSGITKVKTPFESGAPGPYIEEEFKLRMNSDGEYLYVAREYEDTMNEGETTIYYYVVSLTNGQLRANQIATEIRTVEPDGKESVRYGDDEYEMTEAEFKATTDKNLPAIQHILKVSWGDGNAVAGMNDGKSLEHICFKLTK